MQALKISLALFVLASLEGCDKPGSESAPASRVVAVAPVAESTTGELCDPRPPGSAPIPLSWPVLASAEIAPPKGPAWINLWATWCPPCIEELPLVRRLGRALGHAKPPITVQLISVDESDEVVRAFAEKHPDARGTARVRDLNALDAWLPKVGLDRSATLPLHLFVNVRGEIVCTRTGAIGEADLPRIQALLESGTR